MRRRERLEELGTKIDDRTARVGVSGLGYVGLPLAVEFAILSDKSLFVN